MPSFTRTPGTQGARFIFPFFFRPRNKAELGAPLEYPARVSLWGIKSSPDSSLTPPPLTPPPAAAAVFPLRPGRSDPRWTGAIMAGKGNRVPGPHLNGFPVPAYSYFFPHMLGSLSPPALPGLPISGYSTPSPASKSALRFLPSGQLLLIGCSTMGSGKRKRKISPSFFLFF